VQDISTITTIGTIAVGFGCALQSADSPGLRLMSLQ